jgi:hypothetical protein
MGRADDGAVRRDGGEQAGPIASIRLTSGVVFGGMAWERRPLSAPAPLPLPVPLLTHDRSVLAHMPTREKRGTQKVASAIATN